MKKYSPEDINILKNNEGPDKFTKFELEVLEKGDGTVKLEYRADKYLVNYQAWEKKPISRKEAADNFILRNTYNKDMGQVLVLGNALIKKGIMTKEFLTITEHELIAATWPNLCGECVHSLRQAISVRCLFGNYKLAAIFANEVFADLEGSFAYKVIKCGVFKKIEAISPQ